MERKTSVSLVVPHTRYVVIHFFKAVVIQTATDVLVQ
jgi:hypothetical protein